ncbi:hypothetical protein [Nocardia sp. NBC_01388]|uniref:hypothetical protein n=1 Tax=Nocardia sp. NBC_01388 TaxID=2903596 RepID=UPI0032434004
MLLWPWAVDHDLHDSVNRVGVGPVGIFGDLFDQVRAAGDLYFDAVSRVGLPHWSKGRITLLGDSASSVSLFGDGSSLAIAAAHTLAEESGSRRTGHRAAPLRTAASPGGGPQAAWRPRGRGFHRARQPAGNPAARHRCPLRALSAARIRADR